MWRGVDNFSEGARWRGGALKGQNEKSNDLPFE